MNKVFMRLISTTMLQKGEVPVKMEQSSFHVFNEVRNLLKICELYPVQSHEINFFCIKHSLFVPAIASLICHEIPTFQILT